MKITKNHLEKEQKNKYKELSEKEKKYKKRVCKKQIP